ncbi:MAG: SDR family NAD(P)-dependent oxidoreductase [Alphaproteobacteria bacterium]|nr:SDR family NAD(P)-dependent oxidoreductase [Alphaproteobacteria bacterium]
MDAVHAYHLAVTLLERGFGREALDIAAKNRELFPQERRFRSLLGTIYYRMEKFQRSAACFAEALALGGPLHEACVGLARSMLGQGDEGMAAQWCFRALQLAPWDAAAQRLSVRLLLKWQANAIPLRERGTAVVTGAARGIGRATVERLVALGFQCLAIDLDADALQDLVNLPTVPTGAIQTAVADVSDRQAVRTALAAVSTVDVLVSNAGIYREARILDVTERDLLCALKVNLFGALVMMQECIPKMVRGSIIIVVGSSGAGFAHFEGEMMPYLSSKAALAGLWGGTVRELQSLGIMSHMVRPGLIDTRMQRVDRARKLATEYPPDLKMTMPSDVANAVAALALRHDALPFVTGLTVDIA